MSQPEQVSQATREFLRPLVGIDPADVQVYHGEEASRAASAHNADAITVQDRVFVAHGQPSDGVEGAALLAHELTHVARQREPGFLPPVARPSSATQQDEEAVARDVEAAVHQAAQAAGSGEWGGLPAPWEPLPDWLTTPPEPPAPGISGSPASSGPATGPATGPAIGPASGPGQSSIGGFSSGGLPSAGGPSAGPASTGVVSTGGAASGGGGGGGLDGVLAAEHGRGLENAGADVTDAAEPHQEQQQQQHQYQQQQAGVEPDLDALARQVYARLKRRLAAEQRRLG